MATAPSRQKVKTFHFVVYLARASKITRRLQDRLYDAGCDDAALVEQNGRLFLDFDREASSMPDAIQSALSDVEQAGLRVSEIVFPDKRKR